jgi:hypothetical protein
VRQRLPFPLLGLDSDNGSEFLNQHLYAYCQGEGITFTRSRPYKKNDSCHVEQKNWSVIRRLVGYDRYSSRAALGAWVSSWQAVIEKALLASNRGLINLLSCLLNPQGR